MFANFRRRPKFRAKLPRKANLRSQKWFRDRRKWRKKYREYLLSEAWKKKRERRLKKCNGICEYCHVSPAVHVHHITYKRVFKEWLKDLRGICIACHKKKHPGKKFFTPNKPKPSNTIEVEF